MAVGEGDIQVVQILNTGSVVPGLVSSASSGTWLELWRSGSSANLLNHRLPF